MSHSTTDESGIYIISNNINGMIYIGQSRYLRARWANHRSTLNSGNHGNVYLQRAWNKYGESVFRFNVWEYCPVEKLDEREQRWLDLCMPRGYCYNISSTAIPSRYANNVRHIAARDLDALLVLFAHVLTT